MGAADLRNELITEPNGPTKGSKRWGEGKVGEMTFVLH